MTRWPVDPLTFLKKNPSRANGRSTYIHPPSLAKIRQTTLEEIGNTQTNKRCSNYSMIIQYYVTVLQWWHFSGLIRLGNYEDVMTGEESDEFFGCVSLIQIWNASLSVQAVANIFSAKNEEATDPAVEGWAYSCAKSSAGKHVGIMQVFNLRRCAQYNKAIFTIVIYLPLVFSHIHICGMFIYSYTPLSCSFFSLQVRTTI